MADFICSVFPGQEDPHRLGSQGGAGRVQGADGDKKKTILDVNSNSAVIRKYQWNMFHPALRVNIDIQKDPIINNVVVIMRSPDDTINDIRIH